MIVLLLTLLIVGFLTLKNMQTVGGGSNQVTLPGQSAPISAGAVVDKFKGDAKQIEELQKRELRLPEDEQK